MWLGASSRLRSHKSAIVLGRREKEDSERLARVFFAGRSGLLIQTRSAYKGSLFVPAVRLSQWSEHLIRRPENWGKSMLGLRISVADLESAALGLAPAETYRRGFLPPMKLTPAAKLKIAMIAMPTRSSISVKAEMRQHSWNRD